uniref:Uncharacterized protein n=1 Tax=Echinococcus granulosus TaxID=6210 RepID=A0A068WWW4_ECHGR|nr:hypothetical protein EgrG_000055000 [Echinococcus granulosus]
MRTGADNSLEAETQRFTDFLRLWRGCIGGSGKANLILDDQGGAATAKEGICEDIQQKCRK